MCAAEFVHCMCAQATSALVELVGEHALAGWMPLLLTENTEASDPFGLVATTMEHVRAPSPFHCTMTLI